MVISRTPRQQDAQMYDDLGLPIREEEEAAWLSGEEGKGKTNEPDPRDTKLDELGKLVASLQQKLEEREQDTMLTAIAQVQQKPQFEPEREVQVPSIDENLDGHIQAMTKNAEIRARNSLRKQQFDNAQGSDLETKTQALFDSFSDKYEDYAAMGQERIEFAATQVAKRARARGLDIERYMFVTSDRFLKDVAKEMERTFGAPDQEDDFEDLELEEERNPRRRRSSPSYNDGRRSRNRRQRNRSPNNDFDDGRATVFGGNDSGGRMSRREENDNVDMIDDLYEIQKGTGFLG